VQRPFLTLTALALELRDGTDGIVGTCSIIQLFPGSCWLVVHFPTAKQKISCLNPRENKSRSLDNQPTLSSYDDGVTFFFFF
jgi:hypothetical protein